jgi:S1-C subfamily serine protease
MLTQILIVLALAISPILHATDSMVMRVRCVHDEDKTTLTEHGSCVAVTDNTLGLDSKRSVLTAAHVVGKPSGTIVVEARTGHWVRCTLEKIDKDRDLALLKAAEDLPNAVRLAKVEALTVIASKAGETVRSQAATPFKIFALCSLFGPGMSGGALIDSNGKLYGIVTAGVRDPRTGNMCPDIGVFISIAEIRSFLQRK